MRGWFVVILIGACSHPHAAPPADGGGGGIMDAGSGSDGGAVCTGDHDQDGICDEQDDCPDVFDPGQADLDGDGLGWVCDPVESVTLPTTLTVAGNGWFALHGKTFAGVAPLGCTSNYPPTCAEALVTASPYGKAVVRTDSTDPGDAWAAHVGFGGVSVIAGDQILVSRSEAEDTGLFDIASRTYTMKTTGVVWDIGTANQLGTLFMLAHTNRGEFDLAVPDAGNLTQIAMATGYEGVWPGPFASIGQPPVFALPLIYPGGDALQTFTPGATSLSDVVAGGAPQTGLDLVKPHVNSAFQLPELPYCAQHGTTYTYLGIRPDGVTSGSLPFESCSAFSISAADTVTNQTLLLSGVTAAATQAAVVVRHGVVTPVATEAGGVFGLSSGQLPVVTWIPIPAPPNMVTQAWVLASSGLVQLSSALENVAISTSGDTVHLAGIQPSGNGRGALVLLRYREATGIQQVTIEPDVPELTKAVVVTTAEGAAIVGDGRHAWALASTATTPVSVNLGDFQGGVRGTATLVIGTQDASHPGSYPALYAYDEPSGTPRLTRLAPESSTQQEQFLDPPQEPPTPWFCDMTANNYALAQIVPVGGVPTLQHVLDRCPGVIGRLSTGDLLAYDTQDLDYYVLGATTAVKVAHVTHEESDDGLVLDRTTWPPVVVGWYGTDATGAFACLASHPDRCWAMPVIGQITQLAASATEPDSDGSFSLSSISATQTSMTLAIVRTMGAGDRPQPLARSASTAGSRSSR